MHAAGSRVGPIMPAACIVTGYCLDIPESASFTAVWSKWLIAYDSKFAYVQSVTGNIERSLSEKYVNFMCFGKKLFSTRALLEESPPGPCLRPWIAIKIWLNFVSKGSINNGPSLVQIMAWCRTGDKPLSDWMMTQFTDAYIRRRQQTYMYSHLWRVLLCDA